MCHGMRRGATAYSRHVGPGVWDKITAESVPERGKCKMKKR
jgi:hypothetical protein